MNINYDKLFNQELNRIQKNPNFAAQKPRLLLHACCAPCSSAVLERLGTVFDISVFFYNPNIHPESEYERRLMELETFLAQKSFAAEMPSSPDKTVFLIKTEYNPQDFFSVADTEQFPERKTEPERGMRCRACYRLRLEKTAAFAAQNSFNYYTSTLSISPHKDSQIINAIGQELELQLSKQNSARLNGAHQLHPLYLYADFKKQNGFKRSLEISAEYNLYRQDYCGCVFSKNQLY